MDRSNYSVASLSCEKNGEDGLRKQRTEDIVNINANGMTIKRERARAGKKPK